MRAVAVLGDWSCSTLEGLDRVGGSWAVPVPSLPLGLLGVVSRAPFRRRRVAARLSGSLGRILRVMLASLLLRDGPPRLC